MKAQANILLAILIGVFIIFAGLLIGENISIVGVLNTTQNITSSTTTNISIIQNITDLKWLNTTEYLFINSSYAGNINVTKVTAVNYTVNSSTSWIYHNGTHLIIQG